jgi:uncharacterized damage-inducible protein DinB
MDAHDTPLRKQLANILAWEDAHVGFERAVAGVPATLRGAVPAGFAHSVWQLVEHLRLAQRDILEFCIDPDYREQRWPDDYWPATAAPPDEAAWTTSLADYLKDRQALADLALDGDIDLFAAIPHGSGQTYLRELLLVADHGAYHIGQIVLVRRALGDWKG